MTELLDFEWERLVDGYRLERVDYDLVNLINEKFFQQFLQEEGIGKERIGEVVGSAPQWLRDLSPWMWDNLENIIGSMVFNYQQTEEFSDWFLVANGRETERYRPVDMYPALFMELADSEATPEGAARFINRYGPPHRHGQPLGEPIDSLVLPSGLSHLSKRMKVMKSAVRSWEKYRKTGNARALIKRVTDEIKMDTSLYVSLREKTKDDTISMVLVPRSLTSAIWLQFAQAITENYGFGQCDECLTWFEIAPGKGRPEKKFCSNACSMRAYRKRKATKK